MLSALFLASLGFVGHAAMLEGAMGWLQRLNHALHLVSAGLWVGVLPPLAICLASLRQTHLVGYISVALGRFSGVGHVAVALVVLTGVINTYFIVGGWPADLVSPYQLLLDIKIGLVLPMALIALANRHFFMPVLISSAGRKRRNLVLGTVAEIVLSAGVIGLVSAFGSYDPG